ncbi:MAG: hypothetical protein AUH84_01445 [Thaumarchaeota archaeon 13_1_40CM_4_38_7]|nr:MAG: hypothetical protein AUH84_01445 [Thaumarchaeota archaeon 13_1_40CM_4_38_7]OLC92230.1 MAG: hypothetical protein AUI92_05750 [Thaumarchaeota archaeon 13_1_40CM_3_38_6]
MRTYCLCVVAISCIVAAQIVPVYAMQYETPPNLILAKISSQDKNCKAGLFLTIKSPENRALCLKASTILKLTLRGWTFAEIKNQQASSNLSGSTSNNLQYLKLPQDLLGPIPHRLVFFMSSDSTAKIFVQYMSDEPNTGTMKSWTTVYVGKANYTPLNSSKLTITADPTSIPLAQDSNTTVVYTITAKKDASGIYWISLAQICGVMPVVIDMESSHLGPSDIPVPTGTMHCPAQLLNAKILGIYGGIAEYKIAKPIP